MIISHSQVENVIKLYNVTNQPEVKKRLSQEEKLKPTGGPDQITLSDEFREYRVAREALAKMPEVREEKVAQIKKLLQEGNYHIDGARVAEKIVERRIVDRLV